MIARDTMVRIQLLARKKKEKKVRRMLGRQKFLDQARDFASRIDLSTKSRRGWFLYD